MKYNELAHSLIELVGGGGNISNLVHCATRLRITLHDYDKAKTDEIKKLKGVMTALRTSGQYQIVIGSEVEQVYKDMLPLIGNSHVAESAYAEKNADEKNILLNRTFDLISGSFTPLVSVLAGAGMIKATLTVLVLLGVMTESDNLYKVIFASANSLFYFLPIFLSITMANKLGINPYVSGAIGAALLEPTFTGIFSTGVAQHIYFLPLVGIDYSYNVFPVFLSIGVYYYLERFLKRTIHKDLQLFLVPMISLSVMVTATVLVFGPFATTVGRLIAGGVMYVMNLSGTLSGAFLGSTWQFLVSLGLHWGLAPLEIENIRAGGDPIGGTGEAVSVYALMGVAIGVWLKARRNPELKAVAGSAALTAILAGVTEPVLYGLVLRFKRLIPIYMIAGGVGGAINGYLGVKMMSMVFHNIFSIPAEQPSLYFICGAFTALGLSAILTYLFGLRGEADDETSKKAMSKKDIPLTGAKNV